MDDLEFLRLLIHDRSAAVWSDPDLIEILKRTADSYETPAVPDPSDPLDGYTVNIYRAAAHTLEITLADPARMASYNRGGVSWSRTDIEAAMHRYRAHAGDAAITTRLTKEY